MKHSFAEALPRRETTTSDLLFLFFGVFGGTASAFIIWFALVKVRAAIKHRHGYDLPPGKQLTPTSVRNEDLPLLGLADVDIEII